MLTLERCYQLRAMIEKASANLTDEDALATPELFPAWESGKAYAVGERVRYNEVLYRVVQAHTSQEDWLPDATPALYTPVAEPGTIPVWVQPTGAQDAYNTGDKVHYPAESDPVYTSLIDGNVWSPEAYPQGWALDEPTEPEEPEEPDAPAGGEEI